jgi:FtsP/CotA-like multicopper oxidase with cupredoxin domain
MFNRKFLNIALLVVVISSLIFGGGQQALAQTPTPPPNGNGSPVQSPATMAPDDIGSSNGMGQMRAMTPAMRMAAASHLNLQQKGVSQNFAGLNPATAKMSPLAAGPDAAIARPSELASMAAPLSPPDYFGIANWANSPLPQLDSAGAVIPGTGMRKFVDGLPGLCGVSAPNDLGQCIPLASADSTTFLNADYYEIGLVEYREQLHADLPATGTKLRGYVQLVPSSFPGAVALTVANGLTMDIKDALGNQLYGAYKPHYLGPIILAQRNRPVRVKFTNLLPTGSAGDLFIPTDTTYMGAGDGPICADGTPATPSSTCARAPYSENRGTLHLHGGNTPWISDGTPHQWTTPAGEATYYSKGVSAAYVPDMWFDTNGNLIPGCAGQMTCADAGATNDPGLGSLSFYWTNQESGRLMFYHDHAYGITRVNVYAGEAAGYLLTDPAQEDALAAATVPGTVGTTPDLAHLIPLVIQDKTFVPDNGVVGGQLAATDPTWDTVRYGSTGDLWFPHVYIPNQNPADVTGANAFGRWDYGAWFWPPQDPSTYVPQGQPYACTSAAYPPGSPPAFPPLMCPGTPNPSGTPEGFMDTPLINGTAYPTLTVDPAAYRFQILTAGNDRTWNLGLYVADPLSVAVTKAGSGYKYPPLVSFTGGGSSGATAKSVMSTGSVTGMILTNVGAGYTVVPTVTISGDGTGATAAALLDPINTGQLLIAYVTNIGTGYTFANVAIDPPGCTPGPGCTAATATATVTPSGSVLGVVVTNPGSGWTSAPTVTFTNAPGDTTGSGAAAIASIDTEVKMVDAVPHNASSTLLPCTSPIATSGAQLALADLDTSGNPLNGTGLPANCWPSSWPTDGRDGGVPDPLTVGPPFVQIGTEGGLLPAPVVIPSTPVNYEYNRRSITVLNVWTHGLLLGPAERADVIVDFSRFAGKTLLLYNDAPAPVPAFDPRNDYYTGDPDQTITGGAPSTLPGYGPNTRTIMQIKVAATGTPNSFSLSTLSAALPGLFATTQEKIIVPQPDYPAGNGGAAQPTYVRIQDTNVSSWVGGPVKSLTLTDGGSGYASAPSVNITGGGGTGATASLTFFGAFVNNLTLTDPGAGYSTAPTISFVGGGGTGAAATASISGSVASIAVTNPGSGYLGRPTVNIANPPAGGVRATATATLKLDNIIITNGGSGYISVPAVTVVAPPAGGIRATATAVLTGGVVTGVIITNPGSGYIARPGVVFAAPPAGGVRATGTTTAKVDAITVTNGGNGYTSPPAVTFATPPGGTAATAAATLQSASMIILLTNGGSGYTSAPTVVFSGGGTPTTPAAATATILPGTVTSLTLTNGGTGYTSPPAVVFSGGGTPTTPAAAIANPPVTQLLPKTIQELFTLDYGRMNATLGVELPFTSFLIQTTIPYGYVDPPTEIFKDGDMQIWKITHNGVDTHFIHFHLFTVQVINRVGWDGAIKPPDANEMSWKDTVRMNPLEDVIVALRPMKQNLPWELPNSVRPLDVTEPVGSNLPMEFTNIDPTNQPATVINDLTNFGWEYVWHCHILGHEENDMMRAMILAVPPDAPSDLAATYHPSGPRRVTLTWTDNAINETSFTVQRATASGGPWTSLVPKAPAALGKGTTVTYDDTTVATNTTYFYRVVANNLVGYTRAYALPAVGYPNLSADSAPTDPVVTIVTSGLGALGGLSTPFIFASGFANGLAGFAGVVGNAQVIPQAALGPNGGAQGLAAIVGGGLLRAISLTSPQPAYVYDTTPDAEVSYDASFYFDPNGANSGDSPVDIFTGLDQSGHPIFGIQFKNDASAPGSYAIRGWILHNGEQVFTQWSSITDEAHKIEVAWLSGTHSGFSLFLDSFLAATVAGDTSAYKLDEILLGPSLGLTANTSGTLYFDEFTSSRISAVQYNSYLPVITN